MRFRDQLVRPNSFLVVLAFTLFLEARPSRGEERVSTPAEGRLRADVSFLADDARDGRAPGTPGIEAAADHIAAAFKAAGLKPAAGADGYFQRFTLEGTPRLSTPLELRVEGPDGKRLTADAKTEFRPLAIGTGGTLKNVPLVFAGYGITAKNESKKLDYDDYSCIDVKGKAVLLLRREPQQKQDDSPFDGTRDSKYATFRHKATNAFQHGAVAVLLVNDTSEVREGKENLLNFTDAGPEPNSSIPFVTLSREFTDRLLKDAKQPSLADLEKQIDSDLKPRSTELNGWNVFAEVNIERKPIETKNVVGVLEGIGPHADETIVVGAHYDHLGHGGLFSGSLAFLSKDIHNGADDNASGTAMVLEMARRLGQRADPLPRRVVFIAFSGEERGLLGSKHYVEHPLYPLDSTVAMANFDMVGRLNDKSELTVYGTGTSPGFKELIEALGNSSDFVIKKVAEGLGPSDQQSFYLKNIPVLFLFTGTHRDYHRPSDDIDRINFAGMARIADYAELLLLDLARRPKRPEFARVKGGGEGHGDPGRVSISVYLGSIPDYDDSVKGVKLSGVREGSPAEKGGLKEGDIIIGFGGKPVSTIYDYTESLGRYKPGDTVDVLVQRNGKETTLKVILGSRPPH
jgi:hypothetical protein